MMMNEQELRQHNRALIKQLIDGQKAAQRSAYDATKLGRCVWQLPSVGLPSFRSSFTKISLVVPSLTKVSLVVPSLRYRTQDFAKQ